MRHSRILFLCVLVATGCRTRRDAVIDTQANADSMAASMLHRSMSAVDSMVREWSLCFDTLEIEIERTAYDDAMPQEVMRLRVTNGNVHELKHEQRNRVEEYNRQDTVAYKVSQARSATEHTTTTRVYNPPDGTVVLAVAITVIALVLLLVTRRLKK